MTFNSEGWQSGSELYDLMQSVHAGRLQIEAHTKASIEAKLGHSIETLKNEPSLLRELLSDKDEEKRSWAVTFLSRFDQNLPDFEQIFQRLAVEDPARVVRATAILWLGELGKYRHRLEIVTLLHSILTNASEEAYVRKYAYMAMTYIDLATREDDGFHVFDVELMLALGNPDISVEECVDVDVIRRLMGPAED